MNAVEFEFENRTTQEYRRTDAMLVRVDATHGKFERCCNSLYDELRCVAFASTLLQTQHDARIDSDPILAFLCVGSLRLIAKKIAKHFS